MTDAVSINRKKTIIISYLFKTYNSISVANYNKLAKRIGLEKENKETLEAMIELMLVDQGLKSLYNDVLAGHVDLSFLSLEEKEIFNVLSPQIIAKEEVLANNREFKHYQRAGANTARLFDGLKEALRAELLTSNRSTQYIVTEKKKVSLEDKEMIVGLSDWHIGAIVHNHDTGGYNYDILQQRIAQTLEETILLGKQNGVSSVHVYFIGDLIEHINMRNVNQAFEAEFTATEQIAKGQRLLLDIITVFANEFESVTFGIVGGNHDRFQGNKGDKIYNDNVAFLVLDMLFFLQELGSVPTNVKLIDNRKDVYEFTDNVAGKVVKVVHGDHEAKKEDAKIRKHVRRGDIDYLIMGHIHTSRIVQEDFSRYHIYVGSPMGANSYSKENNFPTTYPSQMAMLISARSNSPIFKPIMLK